MQNRQNETGALPKVAVTQIKPGINPRTKFSEAELRELGQSMKDMDGPVQPVVVYLDDDGQYALIAGERRWRAAKLVGIEELEVVLRQRPAEKDARKMALLENMQREALTPWEVALAVRDMLAMRNEFDVPVYSKAQLADELGKSPPFISWCEALLRCSEKLQNAVHAGEVEFRLAAMVGSLPTDMHEMAEMDMVFRPGGPMTRDAAANHIAEKYRRDLRKAQFKTDDESLLPGVPACLKCEFNGANRADVVGKHKASTCLNPACFDRKQGAFIKLSRAHADDGDGVRMIDEPKEREKIFSFDGVTIKGDCGYVAADETPDKISLINPNAQVPAWGPIMEETGQPPVGKIVDGEGRVRVLYDARLAHQAAIGEKSSVKALFKPGSAASAPAPSAKSGSGEDKVTAAKKAAREAAEAKGCILAGQNWLMKVADNLSEKGEMEVVRLVIDRLTEAADRQWMACVLMGDPHCKLDPWEVILGQADVGGDEIPVISLALIARMMRLKGPGYISGSVGDLCTLIGYDTKKEVKAIETAAKAAEAAVKSDETEQLFDCDKCGGKNFTKSGLKSHKCERRQAKAAAAAESLPEAQMIVVATAQEAKDLAEQRLIPQSPQRGGKREKNAEAEALAWAAYLETGSIAKAAEACGLDVESVKNWHKRRKWKDKRAQELAKQTK